MFLGCSTVAPKWYYSCMPRSSAPLPTPGDPHTDLRLLPVPLMTATQRQGHRHTNHPRELRLDLRHTQGHAITCMVTWTDPLRATLTKSHRQRQPRTLQTILTCSHKRVTHPHPPLPRASPTPHLPWPPPGPFPSSPRRLFPPLRVRAWEAAGPGSGPAAWALSTRKRCGPWGSAGGPASEGRGAQPSEPRPPPSLLPKLSRSWLEPRVSGFGGAGPRREEGVELRDYGGHHGDGAGWTTGWDSGALCTSCRVRSRHPLWRWRRARGGGPRSLWVSSRSPMWREHLGRGRGAGRKGRLTLEICLRLQFAPSWRKQMPTFSLRRVKLWGDPFGLQALMNRALYILFSWQDFFPLAQLQTPSLILHCNAPTSLPRLVLRSWGFRGTAPTEPPAPSSLSLKGIENINLFIIIFLKMLQRSWLSFSVKYLEVWKGWLTCKFPCCKFFSDPSTRSCWKCLSLICVRENLYPTKGLCLYPGNCFGD